MEERGATGGELTAAPLLRVDPDPSASSPISNQNGLPQRSKRLSIDGSSFPPTSKQDRQTTHDRWIARLQPLVLPPSLPLRDHRRHRPAASPTTSPRCRIFFLGSEESDLQLGRREAERKQDDRCSDFALSRFRQVCLALIFKSQPNRSLPGRGSSTSSASPSPG